MTDELDLEAMLAALDRGGVRYVIAGSVAAMIHGAPGVPPADLDIVPSTDEVNLARLATVLGALEAEMGPEYGEWRTDEAGEREWVQDGVLRPPRPLLPADSTTFDHWYRSPYGAIDIVPEIAGTFAVLRPRAQRAIVGDRPVWVASPADVLAGMSRPRRAKDGPRLRHLRELVAEESQSRIGFVGLRTDRFAEMVALLRDLIRLEVSHEAPGVARFRLGADAELHLYADSDPDHAFFTTGPVVGMRVEDVVATRAALEADGVEMLTEIERSDYAAWCHFRAADGTVLEIIGPA